MCSGFGVKQYLNGHGLETRVEPRDMVSGWAEWGEEELTNFKHW